MPKQLTECKSRKPTPRRATKPSTQSEREYVATAVLRGASDAVALTRILPLPAVLTETVQELSKLQASDASLSSKRARRALARTGRTLLSFLQLVRQHDWVFVFARHAQSFRDVIAEIPWNNLVLMQEHAIDVLCRIAVWPKHFPIQPNLALRRLLGEAHPNTGRLLHQHDIARLHRLVRDFALSLKRYAAQAPQAA